MANLTMEIKVTELELTKELINLVTEFYIELPEEMRVRFDEWEDKLKGRVSDV